MLGAVLAGLVLLPRLGMEGTFALGLVANLAAAALALLAAPGAPAPLWRRFGPLFAGVSLAAVYLTASAGWSRVVGGAGTYRHGGQVDIADAGGAAGRGWRKQKPGRPHHAGRQGE